MTDGASKKEASVTIEAQAEEQNTKPTEEEIAKVEKNSAEAVKPTEIESVQDEKAMEPTFNDETPAEAVMTEEPAPEAKADDTLVEKSEGPSLEPMPAGIMPEAETTAPESSLNPFADNSAIEEASTEDNAANTNPFAAEPEETSTPTENNGADLFAATPESTKSAVNPFAEPEETAANPEPTIDTADAAEELGVEAEPPAQINTELKADMATDILAEETIPDVMAPAESATLENNDASSDFMVAPAVLEPTVAEITPTETLSGELPETIDMGSGDAETMGAFAAASGSTNSDNNDPADTLKQLRSQIKGFAKAKRDEISGYESEIKEHEKNVKKLREKIKAVKKEMTHKKHDYTKMLTEMKNFTENFTGEVKPHPHHKEKPKKK
jgi:hypothetical protein